MSNIVSTLGVSWTQGKFRLFQLIVIFTVGFGLVFVGCGEDEDTDEPAAIVGETITVDGRTVVALEGDITEDRTLSSDYDYLLSGPVFVKDGATLTIQPGVTIYGEQVDNGTLIIDQGAKIIAEGTADAPIVYDK